MEMKIIKHGNHVINNDTDGYMYNFNTSRGYSFNPHIHKCYEFIHIIHGELIYTVEGTEYMLHDGDFIMTNPDELHSFSFPREAEYQREFLHIYPGFMKGCPELLEELGRRKFGYFNRFPRETVEKYGIDKIFRDIEAACSNVEAETDYIVLGLSIELFALINQILRKETPVHQTITANKKANAVCDYIDKHYKEEITVDSIAAAQYISPSHLSRMFKKETGMTVKAYLTMRRVTHAKNLIMEGRHMIKNIYFECGFTDYSSFYRSFVKYVGLSPEEFKKGHSREIAEKRLYNNTPKIL